MAESRSHKTAKRAAAGRGGKTEVPLSGKRRLDALSASGKRATEIERSGTKAGLEAAAGRLKSSGASQRVLQVPHKDMGKAAAAMREKRVGDTVKNLGGTSRRSVSKK